MKRGDVWSWIMLRSRMLSEQMAFLYQSFALMRKYTDRWNQFLWASLHLIGKRSHFCLCRWTSDVPSPRVRQRNVLVFTKCSPPGFQREGAHKESCVDIWGSFGGCCSIIVWGLRQLVWIPCLFCIYLYDVICRTWSFPIVNGKARVLHVICKMKWDYSFTLTRGVRVSVFS